jgi:outer membrane protein assembly factor BamB
VFRSVPIPVGDRLWVPYTLNRNLAVAVLDPSTGGLVGRVSLCSVLGREDPSDLALMPASGSGLVFVPSGRGALFCIDSHDYSVRWAVRYDPEEPDDLGASRPRLTSAPVVAGGLVVHAPVERSELMAFSMARGEVAWSAPRDEDSYVVASDGARIWLAGRSVECVALSNGQTLWTERLSSVPTGRAVLSDDVLYVPTLEGLVGLGAKDGAELGLREMPGGVDEHGPLGSLLCLNDAMYSINTSWIRKYPDLPRSRARALAAYEAEPSSVKASLRLGWLELLAGAPQKALELFDGIPATAVSADERDGAKVAHARVEAVLAVSGAEGEATYSKQKQLELLAQARGAARTARDRLRCGLRVAEVLRSLGELTEAYLTLWDIGVESDAEALVALCPQVTGVARLKIKQALDEVREALRQEDAVEVSRHALSDVERAAEQLDGEDGDAEVRRLKAALGLDPCGPAGELARLELIERETARQRFERVEQLLGGLCAAGAISEEVGPMLLRLCGRLRERGGDVSPALDQCLGELERRFGDRYMTEEWQFEEAEGADTISRTVADWVAEVRGEAEFGRDASEFSQWFSARREASFTNAVFSGDFAWSVDLASGSYSGIMADFGRTDELREALNVRRQNGPPRLVRFSGEETPVTSNRVVFHAPGDVVYCQRATDGKLLWHTALRLPNRLHVRSPSRADAWVDMPRRAVVDGQTAVFNGGDGLFAVGLATGRRLWARRYTDPELTGGRVRSDWGMASRDGLLAAMPRPGHLTLMRMLDGSTLWERDLRGERVRTVWLTSDRVLTADPKMERVHLLRRSDGELVGQVLYRQPSPDIHLVELVRSGGVLCGPVFSTTDADGLLAVDLTSGEKRWEKRLEKPLYALFKPQEGYVGVGLLGGDVQILDARTGETILERRVMGAHAVIDGALIDGTFLIEYATLLSGVRYVELTALDVATGEELWRREDAFPLGSSTAPLPIVGGRVPVVLRGETVHRGRRERVLLTMLDVRTGARVGEEPALTPRERRIVFSGDLSIQPEADVIVIGLDTQIHALRVEDVAEPPAKPAIETEGA